MGERREQLFLSLSPVGIVVLLPFPPPCRWAMPVGLIVHPMADEAHGREVPLINLGSAGIIRCRKCRTYMNPFVQWTDSGRR